MARGFNTTRCPADRKPPPRPVVKFRAQIPATWIRFVQQRNCSVERLKVAHAGRGRLPDRNGNKLLLCKVLHTQFPLAGSLRRAYALRSAPLRLRRIYEKPHSRPCLCFAYFDVRIGLRRRLGHKSTSSGGIDTLHRCGQRCSDRPRILRAWIIAAGRHGSDDSRQRTLGGGLRR